MKSVLHRTVRVFILLACVGSILGLGSETHGYTWYTYTNGQSVRCVFGGMSVRATPGGTFLGSRSFGDVGTITGGPQTAVYQGVTYIWYSVHWSTSPTDGWSIQDDLGLLASNGSD